MARNYHDYEKVGLGCSDIATLILVGCHKGSGLTAEPLKFGGDSYYSAYLVDEDAEIGSHYRLETTFNYWMKVYDDEKIRFCVDADEIRVYSAGNYGCIIQVIGKKDN